MLRENYRNLVRWPTSYANCTCLLYTSLQDVSDDLTDMKQAQQQIEDLCKRIYASANQSQTVLLAAFENKIKDLSANIQTQLDEAFNHSIRPQLDRPFANASADTLASFTYRFRTTRCV